MTVQGLEDIECPFCHRPGYRVLEEGGWFAEKCPECRLVFLSPRPTANETVRLYSDDEAHHSASSHLADYGSPASRLETARTLRLIREHTPRGRLLELGPGSGALLAEAQRQGYDVESVELNPAQVQFIRDVLRLPCSESLDAVDGTFDVVYHRDVLSHFSDPIAVFRALHHRLKPGGVHIFETGNGDFHPRFAKLFASFQFPDHLFFFSGRSLELLLAETGFRKVSIHRYALTAELSFTRLINRVRRTAVPPGLAAPTGLPGHPAAVGPLRLLVPLMEYVRYGLRYWVGRLAPKLGRPQTMIVVAVKPE